VICIGVPDPSEFRVLPVATLFEVTGWVDIAVYVIGT
jgi:hypothetical protein